jgi:hypothetical protein
MEVEGLGMTKSGEHYFNTYLKRRRRPTFGAAQSRDFNPPGKINQKDLFLREDCRD